MNSIRAMAPQNIEYTLPDFVDIKPRHHFVEEIINNFECLRFSLKYLSLAEIEAAGVTAHVSAKESEHWTVVQCEVSEALIGAKKLSLNPGLEGGVHARNGKYYLTIKRASINLLCGMLFDKYRRDKTLTELEQYSRRALEASFTM